MMLEIKILLVENFASTGIRTHDPHLPYWLRPLLADKVGTQLVASSLWDRRAAAIATLSVTSNQTGSRRPAA